MVFWRARVEVGVKNPHVHDLRHEDISRLLEASFAIEQVALVTGHEDWKMLRHSHCLIGINRLTRPRHALPLSCSRAGCRRHDGSFRHRPKVSCCIPQGRREKRNSPVPSPRDLPHQDRFIQLGVHHADCPVDLGVGHVQRVGNQLHQQIHTLDEGCARRDGPRG